MPITAPPPPSRVSAAPVSGAEAPGSPRFAALLLASRPERERGSIALVIAVSILLHAFLLLLLVVLGPLGSGWSPALRISTGSGEETVTLLWPGMDVGGAGRAVAPPAPAPAAGEALVTPRQVPRSLPGLPRPGAGAAGAQPGGQGAGAGAGGAGTGAGAGGVGSDWSAAERLRPHGWDRRLWEPPNALLPTQSDADRVASRLQGRIDIANDSAAAVAAAARTGRDWSWRDKNGKLWGVTPDGKVHIAGVTVPIPLMFSVPPGRRDEYERNMANWDDIQRSASRAEIHKTFDERVKAIRERKDKERQERKKQEEQKKATTTSQ